jgi:hypothetical protein
MKVLREISTGLVILLGSFVIAVIFCGLLVFPFWAWNMGYIQLFWAIICLWVLSAAYLIGSKF